MKQKRNERMLNNSADHQEGKHQGGKCPNLFNGILTNKEATEKEASKQPTKLPVLCIVCDWLQFES